jgi:hypothetical protein
MKVVHRYIGIGVGAAAVIACLAALIVLRSRKRIV